MVPLLQRLKERKLVQWALAYLAGAFVVFQLLDALETPLGLTAGIQQTLLAVVGIGFFVTLVLAWYHGEKGRQRASGPELLMVAALLVIAGGVLALLGNGERSTDPTESASIAGAMDDRPSIAVLPFQNRSGIEEDAYFTDGMHDQIITHLTRISGLSVRGLTSVLVYRDSPKNLREIGAELNAGYLVEGGVQRAGETVRINVQLIEAGTDEHIWANTYDRAISVENLLQIQTEIVEAVAEAVRAVVTPEERARIETRPTDNLDAYDLYLLGRTRWANRSPETIREAIEYFEAAIELDSTFVLAYSGLADAYQVLPSHDLTVKAQDVYERAKAAATRALELGPSVGEAHASFGNFSLLYELDWEAGERHLAAAVELAPGYATAHYWYSHFLGLVGREDEAREECDEALSLDPRSNIIVFTCGLPLGEARGEARARAGLEQALALNPPLSMVWLYYAGVMGWDESTLGSALAGEFMGEFATLLGYPHPDRVAAFAETEAALRDEAASEALLDDLAEKTPLDRADLLFFYCASASADVCFSVVEQAVEERHFLAASVPEVLPLRSPELVEDPRWEQFLARIGYPGPRY